jgi:hypothetical protein
VFDFSGISVAAGSTVTATGSLPLVLLSQSDVTIGGKIDASGGGASNNFPSPAMGGPGALTVGVGVGGGILGFPPSTASAAGEAASAATAPPAASP